MNENEFREAYRQAMGEVKPSEELKERVRVAVQAAAADAERDAAAFAKDSGLAGATHDAARNAAPEGGAAPVAVEGARASSATPAVQAAARRHRRRWAVPAAAACLALALAVGLPAVSAHMQNGAAPDSPLAGMADAGGLLVRAYADDGAALPLLEDDALFFITSPSQYGFTFNYAESGCFTGCLMSVADEGVARVQMNLTGGGLYRYTMDSVDPESEPDKMRELMGWKPTARGTGEYFGAYDWVNSVADGSRYDKDGDGMVDEWAIGLSKLYGSTVDVSAADDPGVATGEVLFGLWTDEGEDSVSAAAQNEGIEPGAAYAAAVDQLDGQKLTITATYEDGSTKTQVIALHAADFRVVEENGVRTVLPEVVDAQALGEGESCERSLYGVVESESADAFPLPLDTANDRKDELVGATSVGLDRADELSEPDARFADAPLLAAGETGALAEGLDSRADGIVSVDGATVGDVSATVGALPPNGKTPDEFAGVAFGWLGNFEYFNRCTEERYGYRFNADGSTTDDTLRYVQVDYTVENGTEDELGLRTIWGRMALRAPDGSLRLINCGYEIDATATGDVSFGDDGLGQADPRGVRVAPGGTAHVQVTLLVDEAYLADESLVFVPFGGNLKAPLFSLGDLG